MVAGVLYLISGGKVFAANEVGVTVLFATYLIGGAVSGAMVGLLLPLATSRGPAAVVGTIGTIPMFAGVALLVSGPLASWTWEDLATILVCSTLIGGGLGFTNYFWLVDQLKSSAPPADTGPTEES